MKMFRYGSRDIPVIGTFDTVIVGGGTAGASCGISAAREGNRVLIVEKSISLGGAAVNALVTPVMESFVPHERNFGEIEEELKKIGVRTRDGIMEYVYSTPETRCEALEHLFYGYGGEVLYDTVLVDVIKEGKKIVMAVLSNTDGLCAVSADQFVDATGDALLSRLAGVPTVSGDGDGNNQMASLRFEMGGIDVEKYREYCLSLKDSFSPLTSGFFFESAMVRNKGFKLEPIFRKGIENGYLKEEDLVYYQCFSLPGEPGCMSFNCPHLSFMKKNTDALARSQAIAEGHKMVRRLVTFLQNMMPGFENSFLIRVASEIGIRESYRIVGKYVLNEDDYIRRAQFEDPVAKGDWYIDVHSATKGLVHMEKYMRGEYYEIPYRSLINDTVDNMLTIGRCISTTFLVQASIRVQACVTDQGDCAGKACARARKAGKELAEFDGKGLCEI